MKSVLAAVAVLTVALSFKVGMGMGEAAPRPEASAIHASPIPTSGSSAALPSLTPRAMRAKRTRHTASASMAPYETLNEVIDAYCIDCHSNDLQLGNLSLEGFDIAHADTARLKAEKMIRKLRAEMMPLAGRPRPPSDTLQMVARAIERVPSSGSTAPSTRTPFVIC